MDEKTNHNQTFMGYRNMINFKQEKRIGLPLLCVMFGLSGCMQIMTETAKKAMEDRTTEDQVTDTKIGSGILSELGQKDKGLLLDVTAEVWEQRVLLTGTLDDAKVKQEVVQLVKADTRVKQVYDEILLVSPEIKAKRREQKKSQEKKSQEQEEGGTVDDYWISGKIQAQLVTAKGITSVNYRWHTVGHVVYIIGRARSQAELDKVLAICRGTEGIKQVKQFIEVKPI